jgi:hypothetical protein
MRPSRKRGQILLDRVPYVHENQAHQAMTANMSVSVSSKKSRSAVPSLLVARVSEPACTNRRAHSSWQWRLPAPSHSCIRTQPTAVVSHHRARRKWRGYWLRARVECGSNDRDRTKQPSGAPWRPLQPRRWILAAVLGMENARLFGVEARGGSNQGSVVQVAPLLTIHQGTGGEEYLAHISAAWAASRLRPAHTTSHKRWSGCAKGPSSCKARP